MSSTLSAATQDRKARLAQLKSLKRKLPEEPSPHDNDNDNDDSPTNPPAQPHSPSSPPPVPKPSYLSGRNYDPSTRSAKLGFELPPTSGPTLEQRAADLAAAAKATQAAAVAAQGTEEENKPLDLFALQPKKPNWDLKRDLARKMEVLNVRTENAVARLVRERILGAQRRDGGRVQEGAGTGAGSGHGVEGGVEVRSTGVEDEGQEVGIEGAVLVEATKEREREDEEDARRERELDAELLDGS